METAIRAHMHSYYKELVQKTSKYFDKERNETIWEGPNHDLFFRFSDIIMPLIEDRPFYAKFSIPENYSRGESIGAVWGDYPKFTGTF